MTSANHCNCGDEAELVKTNGKGDPPQKRNAPPAANWQGRFSTNELSKTCRFTGIFATIIFLRRAAISLPPPLDQLAWIWLPSGNADTINLVRAHGKGLVL